mmetsp:Transcript_55565/g.153319  ORF Transcript_55565/g.153319 Transcript_55565/m.153319 type:complete len:325 (-) Transcript_55565:2923-3897(-)
MCLSGRRRKFPKWSLYCLSSSSSPSILVAALPLGAPPAPSPAWAITASRSSTACANSLPPSLPNMGGGAGECILWLPLRTTPTSSASESSASSVRAYIPTSPWCSPPGLKCTCASLCICKCIESARTSTLSPGSRGKCTPALLPPRILPLLPPPLPPPARRLPETGDGPLLRVGPGAPPPPLPPLRSSGPDPGGGGGSRPLAAFDSAFALASHEVLLASFDDICFNFALFFAFSCRSSSSSALFSISFLLTLSWFNTCFRTACTDSKPSPLARTRPYRWTVASFSCNFAIVAMTRRLDNCSSGSCKKRPLLLGHCANLPNALRP